MQKPGKILVVTQYYSPDSSTTATYLTAIANSLALDGQVVVLSGTAGSASRSVTRENQPVVVTLRNWLPHKSALAKRAFAMTMFALRTFFSTVRHASRGDVVLCVTTPFTLPYTTVLAARMRGARTALLVYDLYPEALEMAGLTAAGSLTSRLIRFANGLLFPALDAIITIGRDVENLLLVYRGVKPEQISFIPNWALVPIGYRERKSEDQQTGLTVGLSGNLGFTHSPVTVFEAAELLRNDRDIHFRLSGWGVGWRELGERQAAAKLGNVTLQEPVAEIDLVDFLCSADVWIIPYRRSVVGVSVPSRLYNLLAVGRAVIVAAEPHSEAAMIVEQEKVGWVVPPEDPHQLAQVIRMAASDPIATMEMGRRAAEAAKGYTEDRGLARYRELICALRPQRPPNPAAYSRS